MGKAKIYFKSIIIPLIVGAIVGFIISGFIDYNYIQKPPLSPPAILFPIIWIILYALMGVSYGILKSKGLANEDINLIYYIQLAVNALWPILFFVLKWRLVSFLWILLLVVCIVLMIIKFYEKNKVAGLLQIPYLIWTLFATYLNLGVYVLNK